MCSVRCKRQKLLEKNWSTSKMWLPKEQMLDYWNISSGHWNGDRTTNDPEQLLSVKTVSLQPKWFEASNKFQGVLMLVHTEHNHHLQVTWGLMVKHFIFQYSTRAPAPAPANRLCIDLKYKMRVNIVQSITTFCAFNLRCVDIVHQYESYLCTWNSIFWRLCE